MIGALSFSGVTVIVIVATPVRGGVASSIAKTLKKERFCIDGH